MIYLQLEFEVSLSKPQIKLRWSSGKTSPFHGGITSSILVRSINSHLEYDYK